MTTAEPLPNAVVARKLVLTAVGVFCFVAGLTLVFVSMRAVMDVGGFCASGGPYEIRQECPDGAWLVVVGIFVGLLGTGLVVAGTFRGGPQLWVLAWPALFCALGWNFLEYGIDPPPPEQGLVWGWLVCAVAFLAMGGVPLLFVLLNARTTLWGRDDGPAVTPRVAVTVPRRAARADDTDLVEDLERLSTLHRDGALSDEEFRRAKDARLAEEDA